MHASVCGVTVEIPTFCYLESNPCETGKHCMVGSLTGVVASQSVTEARKGSLSTVGNRA
jgi:hypothetical protein